MFIVGILESARTQAIIRKGYGAGTVTTYEAGSNKWRQFLHKHKWNTSLFLEVSPQQQLNALVAFLFYLVDEKVPHSSLSTAITSVKHWYRCRGYSNIIQQHDGTLKRILMGLAPTARERKVRSTVTKRAVVTIDMLDWLYEQRWRSALRKESHEVIDQCMACLAAHIAFVWMLRCGEYVPGQNKDRAFQGQDVDIILKDKRVITLHAAIRHIHKDQLQQLIESIRFTLVSNKVDQSGKGHPFFLNPTESPLAKRVFKMMYQWFQYTKPKPNEYIFSRPKVRLEGKKLLTTKLVNEAIKAAAKARGFPNCEIRRISTHSLRAGGATYMDSLGYTRDEIKKAGRWSEKGLNDLKYRLVTKVYPTGLSSKKQRRPHRPVLTEDVLETLPGQDDIGNRRRRQFSK